MDQQDDFENDWEAEYVPTAMPARLPVAKGASLTTGPLPMPLMSIHPTAAAPMDLQCIQPGSAWDSQPIPHRGKHNAFPGFAARSALFKATKACGGYDQLTSIKAQGATLQAIGPKLDMRDKRVWEIAIELAKQRAGSIGDRYEIELREFARRMGNNNPNSRALQSIWNSLANLALVRVVFSINKGSQQGVGSLIASAGRDGGKLFLRLNPDFALPALLCDQQFEINSARRSKIGSALGQWLHDFYSTHSESIPIDLAYLMELSGYDGAVKNFPARLKAAMEELVSAAPEVVQGYSINSTTRSGQAWTIQVQLGEEKRARHRPAPMPTLSKASLKVAL